MCSKTTVKDVSINAKIKNCTLVNLSSKTPNVIKVVAQNKSAFINLKLKNNF